MEFSPFIQRYLRLVAVSVVTAIGIAVLGYYPTIEIAGRQALSSMLAGIGASLAAGLIGAVPVGLVVTKDPKQAPQAILLATALRFTVVLALALVVIFCGRFDRTVAAMWIGISYLVMLAVDTVFAVRAVAAVRGQQ